MFRTLRKALAVVALALPVGAFATPITVDFTFTATYGYDGSNFNASSYNGYGSGTVGTGSFTFDDSIGSFYDVNGGRATTDLTLSWLGTTWNESSARLFSLNFNPSGTLVGWGMGGSLPGTSCATLNCVSSAGVSDFWANAISGGGGQSVLHNAAANGWMYGSINWTARPVAVPEPSLLAVLTLGLLGVAALRRRSHS